MKKITCFLLSCFVLLSSLCFAAPPTFITITSPQDGSYISNTVTIEAQLTQIPRVRYVKFYIDNQLVGEDTTLPYQYTWDTTAYSDGQHTIYASMLQAPERPVPLKQGNLPVLDSPKITVTVDNTPPSVTIITPQEHLFVAGTITTEVQVTDNFGIFKVEFKLDDVLIKEFSQSESYIYAFDTTQTPDGNHTFTVTAYDLANNSTTSLVTFTVDNSPPTTPVVTDDGAYTTSLNSLHATWVSQDPESGIVECQYSIGTTKGGTDLIDWTSVGSNTEITINNLTLSQGKTYYFNVKAKNGVGLWSQIGSSDGIIANDGLTLLINITSPKNNALFNTPNIQVEGAVSRNDALVTVNGISAQVTNYTFTVSGIALTEGTNIITAKATKDTKTAQDTINVVLDQDPPSINIFVPDNNSTTKSNIVYGRVSDDTQTVTVNGTSAELLSDFRFIARPPLQEGPTTITVEATDLASNTNQKSINITYNTTTPKVVITSPLDNSEINISPIKVEGTNTQDLKYILIGSLPARITEGNFIVENVTLYAGHTVITAEGYDTNDNLFEDSVFIKSPQLANYQFTEVSGDAYEYEDTRPIAGATQTLKVTLEKNSQPAPNEEIQFNIIEGNGTLSQTNAFTDINGDVQVILTTDTNSSVTNKVDCFVSNNPLVKTTFVVYTKTDAPSNLTKVSDDTITPVPSATVDLIVKLTDANNNPIPNENINFQITQGTGILSATQAATTYYGEAKVTLTTSVNPNETTQVTATSATNPNLSVVFNITTSQATTLNFNDVMNRVNENGNRIQHFMADVVKTSDEPGIPSEEGYKIWQKGSKTKIQLLYPEQRSYIIERTQDSINLNGVPFLTIEDQGGTAMTTTDSIESFSGDIFVLKRSSISPNFQQITKVYVDYSKGVITKVYSEYSSEVGKGKFEEERSYILIDEIWVADNIIKKSESLIDNSVYTTTEGFSNIILNSGIPDSVFQ
ncbi:MAG: Ig-like domain-containing protein [Candidatus Omnitrophota bacterium]